MKGRAEVKNGVDRIAGYDGLFRGKRLGLVTNPTGVDRRLIPTADILLERYSLAALFAPEHGIRGDGQAGDAVETTVDRRTGLPVHSLYGNGGRLPDGVADALDMIVFDMQDAGARYYTYLYTLDDVMRGAAEIGIPVTVLDRVNPINGRDVEGAVLDERFASFVGRYAIPARYGMTIGEFARCLNAEQGIGCDLTVVPCEGWARELYFSDTDLMWLMPSPNMPTPDTALCYPGTCLFEGTNLSEGRGTTKPFELVGAPWVDADGFSRDANTLGLEGVLFRPAWFRPGFSKHAGELCGGVQLHVVDRDAFRPFLTGLKLVELAMRYDEFIFIQDSQGGYFIDNLLGSDAARQPGFDAELFINGDKKKLADFLRVRERYLIY